MAGTTCCATSPIGMSSHLRFANSGYAPKRKCRLSRHKHTQKECSSACKDSPAGYPCFVTSDSDSPNRTPFQQQAVCPRSATAFPKQTGWTPSSSNSTTTSPSASFNCCNLTVQQERNPFLGVLFLNNAASPDPCRSIFRPSFQPR